jgi:hypothetical protein
VNLMAESAWMLPAAVLAVGALVVARLAALVAARAEALRASLVEVPAIREPLRRVYSELHDVRLTVEDLHRR